MATRQYIGARYVPLYAGDWDATKNYEPLTIVTDANGNSFTSLKDVPAGTALTDRGYWVQTSSFSGTIDVLRRDLSQAQNDIQEIEDVLAANEKNEVLLISDSYGQTQDSEGQTAPQRFVTATGLTVRNYTQGGASFKAGTLLNGLTNFTTPDDSAIKTIIIFCGANDAWGTHSAIVTGIRDMIAYCKSRFVNAKKIVLCCPGTTMSSQNGAAREREKVIRAYVYGAYVSGITYLENSESTLHCTAFMKADTTHPNDIGVSLLTKMLVAAYNGDSYTIHESTTATLTANANAPANFTLQVGTMNMFIDNDKITLKSRNPQRGLIAFTSGSGTLDIKGSDLLTLIDFSESVISTLSSDTTGYFSIPGLIQLYGESVARNASLMCVIEDKTLKAYLITAYNPATEFKITAFVSTAQEIVLPINRF